MRSAGKEPILLKAIPRSGGTLFITMLDAHPNVAMSYEVYENNLLDAQGEPLNVLELLQILERDRKPDDTSWIKQVQDPNTRVFLFRAQRSGLSVSEIMEEMRAFTEGTGSFNDSAGRLDFIECLMDRKRRKAGKSFLGGKTQSSLITLHDRYPNATFFIMIRDIRDIYSSLLNVGKFNYTAREAAESWKSHILQFRDFVAQRHPNAMEVGYEALVTEPSKVLREACDVIGVPFSPEMVSFHEKDMTLFNRPYGHLSSDQLQRGLNTQSIGRWRRDLNSEQVNEIMFVAGELLNE
jgi:hypothetical protein